MEKLDKLKSQFNRVVPSDHEKYLNTLKNYIDDKAFNEKLLVLPKLTSAIVKRLEKTVVNEEQKSKVSYSKSNKLSNRNIYYSKIRHLIFDTENNHSDFSKVEEALENKTKVVTNPSKVFLQETNEKIVQQALGMIVDNVFRDRPKRIAAKQQNNPPQENNTNISTINDTNLNTSVHKTETKQLNEEMNWFKKEYVPKNQTNIITSSNLNKVNNKKTKKPKDDISNNTNIRTVESRQAPTQKGANDSLQDKTTSRSRTLPDLTHKYLTDLKNKFKITDDSFLQNKVLDQFFGEVVYKYKISKENIKTFDMMSNLEKIRCIKNHKDLSSTKCVVKEIDLTPEKVIFLIYKRTIDFRILIHMNFSKTFIGDLGCSYILYLIDQYSKEMTYLNLSYTKFGKVSSELLSGILSRKIVKISSLNISGNQLGDKVFCEICLGISKNDSLERLWSIDNNLGKTSAMILGTLLKYDKKIKMLDLSKNYFVQYIYNIFKGLIMNTTLEILTLRECDIENSELKSLTATLHLNHTLKELYLDSNKFTNQSCILISNILNSNHSIEILSILGNKIDIEGVEEIIDRQKLTPIKVWNKSDYLKQKMDNNIESIIYEYF